MLKLFFAFCIIGIHTHILDQFSEVTNWYLMHLVFRMAVPFFFVASGYFFGKKFLRTPNFEKERILLCNNYAKKLLPAFLFWSFLSLFRYGFFLFYGHKPYAAIKIIQTMFFYPLGAMWYVLASILAVLLIGRLWNFKKILLLLGVGGYCFCLLCNSYYFLIVDTWFKNVVDTYMLVFISARNFLGVGVIFIGSGIWLSSDNCFLNKLKTKGLLFLLLLLEALFVFEVWFTFGKEVLDDSSCFFVTPFLSVVLLAIALRIEVPYTLEKSVAFRRLSGYLFFSHSPINKTIGLLVLKLTNNYNLRFIIVVSLCFLIWSLTKNSKNKFIRAVLP